jgi:hypothetical protein
LPRISLTFYFRLSATLFVAMFLVSTRLSLADPVDDNQIYATEIQNGKIALANQDYVAAFNDFLLANQSEPTQPDAINDVLTTIEQNTPNSIDLTTIVRSTGPSRPFNIMTSPTEVGTLHFDYKTIVIVPTVPLPTDALDPVDNWPFSRSAYVYSSSDGSKANLICTMHYQSADIANLALHMGKLLALLDDVYTQKMAAARADDGYPFNVWLCDTAPVSSGGEQWQNNIYFYDVGDDRSSIEWIREIAHEFSHLAFQAVGGTYTFPEAFANGYLGERLLVRWLARGSSGGRPSVEADWGRTFAGYPNFDRLLLAPALKEFSAHGLTKIELARRDDVGMRYMIGMMLYVDDNCGSATVGSILQSIADQHSAEPNLLYEPVREALAKIKGAKNTACHAK